jgi:hypothetical protein
VWAGSIPGPHVFPMQPTDKRHTISSRATSAVPFVFAAALCALAGGVRANAAGSQTCSAHAQLGDRGIVMLTFSCTGSVTHVRVDLPRGAKASFKPSLHVGNRAIACTLDGRRTAMCVASLPAGRAAAVAVGWHPGPAAGDPLVFTATGPRATVKLHLAVATVADTDGD